MDGYTNMCFGDNNFGDSANFYWTGGKTEFKPMSCKLKIRFNFIKVLYILFTLKINLIL